MSRSKHEWAQFEVKRTSGSECWVVVRHRGGAFRVPGDVTIEEVVRGVQEQWTMSTRTTLKTRARWVRVPQETWLEFDAWRAQFGA